MIRGGGVGTRKRMVKKLRQLRSRCSKPSTYLPVYASGFSLPAALLAELFDHSLEGRARAKLVLGTFAETKVPRRAGAKPRF